MMLPSEPYRTKDLAEAASLYAVGQQLRGLEQNESGKGVFFIFTNATACKEVSRQFWSGELVLSARKLTTCLRELKDLIFAQGR